jgi:hypothetical protein
MLIDKRSISADEYICLMYLLNVGGQMQQGVKVDDVVANMKMLGDRTSVIYMLDTLLLMQLFIV